MARRLAAVARVLCGLWRRKVLQSIPSTHVDQPARGSFITWTYSCWVRHRTLSCDSCSCSVLLLSVRTAKSHSSVQHCEVMSVRRLHLQLTVEVAVADAGAVGGVAGTGRACRQQQHLRLNIKCIRWRWCHTADGMSSSACTAGRPQPMVMTMSAHIACSQLSCAACWQGHNC